MISLNSLMLLLCSYIQICIIHQASLDIIYTLLCHAFLFYYLTSQFCPFIGVFVILSKAILKVFRNTDQDYLSAVVLRTRMFV